MIAHLKVVLSALVGFQLLLCSASPATSASNSVTSCPYAAEVSTYLGPSQDHCASELCSSYLRKTATSHVTRTMPGQTFTRTVRETESTVFITETSTLPKSSEIVPATTFVTDVASTFTTTLVSTSFSIVSETSSAASVASVAHERRGENAASTCPSSVSVPPRDSSAASAFCSCLITSAPTTTITKTATFTPSPRTITTTNSLTLTQTTIQDIQPVTTVTSFKTATTTIVSEDAISTSTVAVCTAPAPPPNRPACNGGASYALQLPYCGSSYDGLYLNTVTNPSGAGNLVQLNATTTYPYFEIYAFTSGPWVADGAFADAAAALPSSNPDAGYLSQVQFDGNDPNNEYDCLFSVDVHPFECYVYGNYVRWYIEESTGLLYTSSANGILPAPGYVQVEPFYVPNCINGTSS